MKPVAPEVREEGVPLVLRSEKRWTCWNYVRKDGKWTKRPMCSRGGSGSSTEEGRWSTFEEALEAVQSGRFDGVGFVLGGGWVGVDFDGCRGLGPGGEISEVRRGEMSRFPGWYWEVSPSGTGVHGIGRGGEWMEKGLHKKKDGVEIYPDGRYFTVTGRGLSGKGFGCGGELREHDDELRELWEKYGGSGPVEKDDGTDWSVVTEKLEEWFPDDTVIEMAEEDDGWVGELWNMDYEAVGRMTDVERKEFFAELGMGYPSQSEADMALLGWLLGFCGPDKERLFRLFSESNLGKRSKWSREKYRTDTADQVIPSWKAGAGASLLRQVKSFGSEGGWGEGDVEEGKRVALGGVVRPAGTGAAELSGWVKKVAKDYAGKTETILPEARQILLDEGLSKSEARKIVGKIEKEASKVVRGVGKGVFLRNEHGAILSQVLGNVELAIEKSGVKVRHNQLTDRIEVDGEPLTDSGITGLRRLIEKKFSVTFSVSIVRDVVELVGRENGYHPVRDYLDGLKWDGVGRIDTWLERYAGVGSGGVGGREGDVSGGGREGAFVRAVSALVLIAAVRRVRVPGCKFDEMLILEGPQGGGKSSLWRVMAGEEWFSDDCPLGASGREFVESTEGSWIIEAAELASFRRGDHKRLKSILSQPVDKARKAYGYISERRPRQFILVGTTNESEYLEDPTGGRRYWPVRVGEIDIEGLGEVRDQLWAEAAAREASGESIRLDQGLWYVASEEQGERRVHDPWEDLVRERIGDVEGKIASVEVFKVLRVEERDQNACSFSRLRVVMEKLGWEHAEVHVNDFGRRARGYRRGESKARLEWDEGGGVRVHGEGPY